MANILVVDDNDSLRSIIAAYLEGQGHECTMAADVKQARGHLMKKRFEVTISDFHMPHESGLDLLKFVADKSPTTFFILMGGFLDSDIRKKALDLGALTCLSKPFRLDDLLDRVNGVLEPVPCAQCGN